jgi:tetratricopeptide (TPR) repeat protein
VFKLKIKLYFICIISVALFGFLSNVYPQFDDDEFGEAELVCIPESLTTAYDKFENDTTSNDDVILWYSFGTEYHKNKDYNSSLSYLWKVFLNDTTQAGRRGRLAIRKIADAYFTLKMGDSTFIACYRGLEKFPDNITLHYYAGYLQDNLGKFRCAIPHYEALVSANPEEKTYLEKLAFLYYKDEDERAIEFQERLVKLDNTNSEYKDTFASYLNHFLGAGGALKAREQAYKSDPTNANFAMKYGKSAYEAGEYRKAMVPLATVIKQDPNNVEAYEIRALCCENMDDYIAAIADYKKIIEIYPSNVEIMCAIAHIYWNLNQFTNGRYWVRKALQTKPKFGLAYIRMAELYEKSVIYCQNMGDRGRKYDDGLVYELALGEYRKALNDPAFRSDARKRINSLTPYLPTEEEKFMNMNRKNLQMDCYSWIK